MPSTFWFAILAGYLLGVAAAGLMLPAATVTALALPLGIAAAMLAAAAAVAVVLNRAQPPRVNPAASPQTAGTEEEPAATPAPEPVVSGPSEAVPPTPVPVPDDTAETRGLLSAADVRRALDEGRVEVVVQPIVMLPQRRTVFYEGFARLRDEAGEPVPPARYLPVADAAGLVGRIDLALLFGCARVVRRGLGPNRRGAVFCNVAPASLADPAFVAEVVDFLGGRPDLAERLVIEPSGRDGLDAAAWRTLQELRRLGLRLSLDHPPERGEPDAAELARLGVSFVKLGARRFEAAAGLSHLDPELVRLHAALEAVGITAIVNQIETERTLAEVLDYPVRYGQGHLFGPPEPLAA